MRFYSLGFALLLVSGCSEYPPDNPCDDPGNCVGRDGGNDVVTDVIADVQGCDISKDPKDSPKCVDDAIGRRPGTCWNSGDGESTNYAAFRRPSTADGLTFAS